uniref:ER membrane protein complex subunit 10 n=1 Tax=Lynceus sp. MCZ IZ 141354 TaxID=1930659 RepID=A0A9N6WRS1_9CRUS|nr:EOG090X0JXR [Lynceus sp. MCZ IZ 141354]
MQKFINCVWLLAVAIVATAKAEIEIDGQYSFQLFHSLDQSQDPFYTSRGQVNVQSLRSGLFTLNPGSLDADELEQLKKVASEGGFYRLKAVVQDHTGKERSLQAFTKACSILKSGLSDSIGFHFDSQGNPVGMGLTTFNPICEGEDADETVFSTSAQLHFSEPGPQPDVTFYVQRQEQEKVAKERGDTKDNRSFFAKYWMYILPVALLLMMSGGASGGEQGGR